MEDNQDDCCSDGPTGIQAGTTDNQTEVTDSRVGKDFLAVALADRNGSTGKEGKGTTESYTLAEEGSCVSGSESQDDVYTGLNHGGGVKQCGDRSRRNHRSEQPALEGT